MKSYPLSKSMIQDLSRCLLREELYRRQSAEGLGKSALAYTAESAGCTHFPRLLYQIARN